MLRRLNNGMSWNASNLSQNFISFTFYEHHLTQFEFYAPDWSPQAKILEDGTKDEVRIFRHSAVCWCHRFVKSWHTYDASGSKIETSPDRTRTHTYAMRPSWRAKSRTFAPRTKIQDFRGLQTDRIRRMSVCVRARRYAIR